MSFTTPLGVVSGVEARVMRHCPDRSSIGVVQFCPFFEWSRFGCQNLCLSMQNCSETEQLIRRLSYWWVQESSRTRHVILAGSKTRDATNSSRIRRSRQSQRMSFTSQEMGRYTVAMTYVSVCFEWLCDGREMGRCFLRMGVGRFGKKGRNCVFFSWPVVEGAVHKGTLRRYGQTVQIRCGGNRITSSLIYFWPFLVEIVWGWEKYFASKIVYSQFKVNRWSC